MWMRCGGTSARWRGIAAIDAAAGFECAAERGESVDERVVADALIARENGGRGTAVVRVGNLRSLQGELRA